MMKSFLLTTSILLSMFSFGQTAYEKKMTEKIDQIEQCKTPEDFQKLSDDFARIATKETKQWLPLYYAGFTTIQKGRVQFRNQKLDELDQIADTAEKYIQAAETLNPSAENHILLKMLHSLKMMVNPQQRYMTEGALAAQELAKAEKLDPENPRITLLKAEDTYYTPSQYGGSKEKGMSLFEKSIQQFNSYKPKTTLDPNWGKSEAEYHLKMKAQN